VEFRVLGPLVVVVDGRAVGIGSRKQRMLLAALAAEPGRAIAADALVEVLWAAWPPASVGVTLRGLVSRLRATLGPAGDRLLADHGGYLLRATPDEVDAGRFFRLLACGREELAAERPADAVGMLRDALGLWRGAPLGDLGDAELARETASRLAEARAAAVEEAAAEVAAGRPGDAVDRLEPYLAAHPLRERGWEQLMLALYRRGRHADALAAYRRVRRTLRDELDVEPVPRRAGWSGASFVHDPGLDSQRLARVPAQHNLPAALTPLVGLSAELATLMRRLPSARLLTLTGVGGVGKTRLELQLARDVLNRFDAVRLVELGPPPPDGPVDAEVARGLGVGTGAAGALAATAEHLEGRRQAAVAAALADGDGPAARQVLAALWPYWTWNGRTEAVGWLERALELDGPDPVPRAYATLGLAVLLPLWEAGPVARSDAPDRRAQELAAQAGDDRCQAAAHFLHGDFLTMRGDWAGGQGRLHRCVVPQHRRPCRGLPPRARLGRAGGG
jgi:DNA-binding SARP family transcriptional activator